MEDSSNILSYKSTSKMIYFIKFLILKKIFFFFFFSGDKVPVLWPVVGSPFEDKLHGAQWFVKCWKRTIRLHLCRICKSFYEYWYVRGGTVT